MRVCGQLHNPAFSLPRKMRGFVRRLTGPRSGLNTVTKKKQSLRPQRIEPRFSGSPSHCPVTILKEVHRIIPEWAGEFLQLQGQWCMSIYLVDVEATDVPSISFCGRTGNWNCLSHTYKWHETHKRGYCSVFLTILHTTFHAIWLHTASSNQFVEFPLLGFVRNTHLHK